MNKNYEHQIHIWGRLWTVAAILLFIAIPVIISVSLGSFPGFGQFLAGYLPIIALFGPVGVIEVLTYAPMLGSGGTYLGFVTGNLSTLKVPCALNAMTAAKVDPGTKEGEIISTISVAVSSIVTTVVLAVGVFSFSFVMPILNAPVLAPAFANLLPALFGGLGLVYIVRNKRIAPVPIAVMLVLFIISPSLPVGILIPVAALVSIAYARFLYKKGRV